MASSKLQYKKMLPEELIVLSQKNDLKALEELLRREQKNIFTTFSYLSKKRENVADLTQEALLRIAKNIHTLKNPKTFKSWTNQIVTNLFYDELRKSSKRPEIISIDENIEQDGMTNPIRTQIPDKKCKPHEKCMSSELENIIKNEIQNLPEPFRIAILLREFQGLSYEEIAIATNSSIGTVK